MTLVPRVSGAPYRRGNPDSGGESHSFTCNNGTAGETTMKAVSGRSQKTHLTAIWKPSITVQRHAPMAVALTLLLAWATLSGCRDGEGGPPYVEPKDADAAIMVHPIWGEEFNVFLDGQYLGKISSPQAFQVVSGQHILRAGSGSLAFAIRPGETLNMAIRETGRTRTVGDDLWRRPEDEAAGTEIRIFEP
jgi:hypothetical protein